MSQAAGDAQTVAAIFEIACIDLRRSEIFYAAESDSLKPLRERAGIEKSAEWLARGGNPERKGVQGQASNPI